MPAGWASHGKCRGRDQGQPCCYHPTLIPTPCFWFHELSPWVCYQLTGYPHSHCNPIPKFHYLLAHQRKGRLWPQGSLL